MLQLTDLDDTVITGVRHYHPLTENLCEFGLRNLVEGSIREATLSSLKAPTLVLLHLRQV